MDKQFAVLGLGSFGSSVALTLENMGCDVLVVDESYEKVQEISDKVSYAVKADVSEPDALQALGGRNLDGVVVAISEKFRGKYYGDDALQRNGNSSRRCKGERQTSGRDPAKSRSGSYRVS